MTHMGFEKKSNYVIRFNSDYFIQTFQPFFIVLSCFVVIAVTVAAAAAAVATVV